MEAFGSVHCSRRVELSCMCSDVHDAKGLSRLKQFRVIGSQFNSSSESVCQFRLHECRLSRGAQNDRTPIRAREFLKHRDTWPEKAKRKHLRLVQHDYGIADGV